MRYIAWTMLFVVIYASGISAALAIVGAVLSGVLDEDGIEFVRLVLWFVAGYLFNQYRALYENFIDSHCGVENEQGEH